MTETLKAPSTLGLVDPPQGSGVKAQTMAAPEPRKRAARKPRAAKASNGITLTLNQRLRDASIRGAGIKLDAHDLRALMGSSNVLEKAAMDDAASFATAQQ